MNAEEVLQLFRVYRHDLMNDLQLIQGYFGMGKHEKSNEKLKAFIEKLNQERQLQTLDAPQFVLWLLTLNIQNKDLQMTFDVEPSDEEINHLDHKLKEDGEKLFDLINTSNNELIEVNVKIKYDQGWNIIYKFENELEDMILNQLKTMKHHNNSTSNEIAFIYK